jgi:hypothetical protein
MHCTSHQILQVRMNDVQRVGMVRVQLDTHNTTGLHALFDTHNKHSSKIDQKGGGV